jgi:hypothetical protein
MSQMIETMESRLLFTASPATIKQDLLSLTAEGVAAKADLTAAVAQIKADQKTIKAVAVLAHLTKTTRPVLSTFQKDENAALTKYKNTISTILSTGKRDGSKLETALLTLEKHLNSATVQTRVSLDLTALQSVFSNQVVSTVESDASAAVTAVDTDLNAVATAIPSTSTDVGIAETNLAGELSLLSQQASTIQGEVATLATDVQPYI